MINGNFGYKENVMANSNFVGDFEAIWLLTKNGDFRLRGYNQTNDRYFTKSTLTTQGVGLMYKKISILGMNCSAGSYGKTEKLVTKRSDD